MNTIKRGWRKWIISPLAVALILGIVFGVQVQGTPSPVYASGVAATNVTLTGQNTIDHYTYVQFDIGWDYSWRDTTNWDAAWVFVKYRVKTGESTYGNWLHATLSATDSDHTAPTGATIKATFDGKGVFAYRSAQGKGTNNWTGVKLRWNYGVDGVADNTTVQVKIFAIEMVYIPEGAFHLYSGESGNLSSNFNSGNTISSEAAIAEGGITWNHESSWCGSQDIEGWKGGCDALGANYPKGYKAIYCMKYEISQRQYCEFLNTLTATEQSNRHDASLHFNSNRNYIKKTSESPARFGCNANNNAGSAASAEWPKLNESNDGGWTACNWLSWGDGLAYADWAGLRPMTELEYEKICRGPGAAGDEYAWGTTSLTQATDISNANTNTEASSNNANTVYGNQSSVQGPLRCGGLTSATDNREESGATYYGVMEMSGNLREQCITVAKYCYNNSTWDNLTGASNFDARNGDGSLTVDGYANVVNWPSCTATSGYTALGSSSRGGCWLNSSNDLIRISSRYSAAGPVAYRDSSYGFRLVRTADLQQAGTGDIDTNKYHGGTGDGFSLLTSSDIILRGSDSAPTVETTAATNVEETTVTLNGSVTLINATSITERGFVWDTVSRSDSGNVAPTSSGYTNNHTETGSYTIGSFSYSGTFPSGTMIYYRACAKNDLNNWSYGAEVPFHTKDTVTYDANGGSNPPIDPNSPYEDGANVTVLGPGEMTRSGYTFSKWNTASDGSGVDYSSGATFTIHSNVALYAQWTAETYIVTFDTFPANTGNITFDGQSFNDGGTASKAAGSYGISANLASGYAFSKWETEGSLSVADPKSATTTCTVSGDGTLKMMQTEPPSIGGEAFPPNKLLLLAPWITLGAAVIAGAVIFVRRRQAKS